MTITAQRIVTIIYFRSFLQAKFAEEDIETASRIHIKAAFLYEQSHHIDEAIDHYLHAGACGDVFRLLEIGGIPLIRQELPKQESPPLKIFCLGRFRIFVGDREIKNQEWKTLSH